MYVVASRPFPLLSSALIMCAGRPVALPLILFSLALCANALHIYAYFLPNCELLVSEYVLFPILVSSGGWSVSL